MSQWLKYFIIDLNRFYEGSMWRQFPYFLWCASWLSTSQSTAIYVEDEEAWTIDVDEHLWLWLGWKWNLFCYIICSTSYTAAQKWCYTSTELDLPKEQTQKVLAVTLLSVRCMVIKEAKHNLRKPEGTVTVNQSTLTNMGVKDTTKSSEVMRRL